MKKKKKEKSQITEFFIKFYHWNKSACSWRSTHKIIYTVHFVLYSNTKRSGEHLSLTKVPSSPAFSITSVNLTPCFSTSVLSCNITQTCEEDLWVHMYINNISIQCWSIRPTALSQIQPQRLSRHKYRELTLRSAALQIAGRACLTR